jgi:hypothetical protein
MLGSNFGYLKRDSGYLKRDSGYLKRDFGYLIIKAWVSKLKKKYYNFILKI